MYQKGQAFVPRRKISKAARIKHAEKANYCRYHPEAKEWSIEKIRQQKQIDRKKKADETNIENECHQSFRIKPELNKHMKGVYMNGKINDNEQQSADDAQDKEILDDASVEKTDIKMLNVESLKKVIKVCGVCEKPIDDEWKDMIECSDCTEQYHCLCVDIGKVKLKSAKEWKCRLCRKYEDFVLLNSSSYNSFVTRPKF